MRPEDKESEEDDEDEEDGSKSSTRYCRLEELYDVISVVGAGAFGIVIACRDLSSKRRFALKIAAQNHSQSAAFLRREKTMLSKMNHPNIIRVQEMYRQYRNLVIMKMELGKETVSSFLERYQK